MLATVFAVAAALVPAGQSAEGRRIVAVSAGPAAAPVTVLAVGSIHGDEPGGHGVIAALRRRTLPAGVRLVTVRSVNPDGLARGTRQNARGVDLNRNFPHRWRAAGSRGARYWPGPRALSEPESRAVTRLVREVKPDITAWYHQPYGLVHLTPGADARLVREYARRAGLPPGTLPRYRGTATGWQNATFPGTDAFVVELAGGAVSTATAERHARALLAVAGTRARSSVVPASGRGHLAAPRPTIRWRGIPFGAARKRDTRRYARRHYGLSTFELRAPKVIVEHVTAGGTLDSTWNTFAPNVPDPELHELPGLCTHFVVDRDGTIAQFVPLALMCRHTVGLNYTAIGIEHVARTDAELMGNPRQLRASLRLTRWLMGRQGVARRNVIGHNESLSSPYHRERVDRLKTQTHGDMAPATMRRYRRML